MQKLGTSKITSGGCNNFPLIYIFLVVISTIIILVIGSLIAGIFVV